MLYGMLPFSVIVVCLCVSYFMCLWLLFVLDCVVMYGLVLCVVLVCLCSLLNMCLSVVDCLMLYGLFMRCSMFACVSCVCVFCL